MARLTFLQAMFKRFRQPGDIVFATIFLAFSLFLLAKLNAELSWKEGLVLGKQPALWPTIAVMGMVVFGFLHWLSTAMSPRISGRFAEVWFWTRSLEYVIWYTAYMILVSMLGYLPSTVLLCALLTFRVGYRQWRVVLTMAGFGFLVVILFKSFLQVKIPGGDFYEHLPDSMRSVALTYF